MIIRVMAFDFGLARIGVAVGQTLTKTAQPVAVVKAKDGVPDWEHIFKLIKLWKVTKIIVGLPIDYYGNDTDSTVSAVEFSKLLKEKTQKEVILVDERFSTREARWRLSETSEKAVNHLKVDDIAACVICESWLNLN